MKRFYFIYLILGFGVMSCGHSEKEDTVLLQEDTIPVKLISLAQRASEQTIKTSGIFTTDNETALSFKNGGIVSRVYVKEGDAIKTGQLLATLNPTEINAQVQQARLSEEKAKRDYDRAQRLYKDSVATLESLQNAETAYRIAREQVRAANYNSSQTELRATAPGFVLMKMVNDGQVVGPGTPILHINNTRGNDWKLRVGVSDMQWSAIQLGDEAIVYTEVQPNGIPAVVFSKSEGIDPTQGIFTLMLKLRNEEGTLKIGAGMFAQATIKTKAKQKTWQIPYGALLDGDAGKAYVFVTNDGKIAKRVEITTTGIEQDQVQVSAGLENARWLIISGSAYLTDGSPIKSTD